MLIGEKVRLRSKKLEDAYFDYIWRQDPELSELDAAMPPEESFEEYQKGYVWEIEHPGRHRRRFAIETLDGKHIGNCAYFDIEEVSKQAQMGILIGDRDYWGKGYGTNAVELLLGHVFTQNGLDTVFLRTLDWNVRAQKSFAKCGFLPVGKIREGRHRFIVMRTTGDEWSKRRAQESAGTTSSQQ